MSTAEIEHNVSRAFDRKKAAVYALSQAYAAKALAYFQEQQAGEKYWVNETNQAKDRMFAKGYLEKELVGWFMAHGVEYGPWLELSNNRQNEAIRPVIEVFKDAFYADVKAVFGD